MKSLGGLSDGVFDCSGSALRTHQDHSVPRHHFPRLHVHSFQVGNGAVQAVRHARPEARSGPCISAYSSAGVAGKHIAAELCAMIAAQAGAKTN
jgi:hypothetical protein